MRNTRLNNQFVDEYAVISRLCRSQRLEFSSVDPDGTRGFLNQNFVPALFSAFTASLQLDAYPVAVQRGLFHDFLVLVESSLSDTANIINLNIDKASMPSMGQLANEALHAFTSKIPDQAQYMALHWADLYLLTVDPKASMPYNRLIRVVDLLTQRPVEPRTAKCVGLAQRLAPLQECANKCELRIEFADYAKLLALVRDPNKNFDAESVEEWFKKIQEKNKVPPYEQPITPEKHHENSNHLQASVKEVLFSNAKDADCLAALQRVLRAQYPRLTQVQRQALNRQLLNSKLEPVQQQACLKTCFNAVREDAPLSAWSRLKLKFYSTPRFLRWCLPWVLLQSIDYRRVCETAPSLWMQRCSHEGYSNLDQRAASLTLRTPSTDSALKQEPVLVENYLAPPVSESAKSDVAPPEPPQPPLIRLPSHAGLFGQSGPNVESRTCPTDIKDNPLVVIPLPSELNFPKS